MFSPAVLSKKRVLRIRMRIDHPYHSRSRIRMKVKCRIQILIKVKIQELWSGGSKMELWRAVDVHNGGVVAQN